MLQLIKEELRRYARSPLCIAFHLLTLYNAYAFAVLSNGNAADNPITMPIYYLFDTPTAELVLFELLLAGITVSVMIGRAHKSNITRNKLIFGHTKAQIYWSSIISSLIFAFVKGLSFSLIAVTMTWSVALSHTNFPLLYMIAVIIGASLVFVPVCALFAVASLSLSKRWLSISLSVLLIFVGTLYTDRIEQRLNEQEFITPIIKKAVWKDGIKIKPAVYGDPYPNPDYVSGFDRKVYSTIFRLLPVKQYKDQVWFSNCYGYQYSFTVDHYKESIKISYASVLSIFPLYVVGYIICRKKTIW